MYATNWLHDLFAASLKQNTKNTHTVFYGSFGQCGPI